MAVSLIVCGVCASQAVVTRVAAGDWVLWPFVALAAAGCAAAWATL